MRESLFNRIVASMIIAILLVWNLFPFIGHAGGFITPGKAITPGQAITPGTPISGGQFIIPGEVYEPGDSFNKGTAITSGQPILPKGPYNTGSFIIPNAPLLPSNYLNWTVNGLQPGSVLQGGTPINSGDSVNGGDPAKGGNPVNGGGPAKGGNPVNGGDPVNGGNPVNGGDPANGGNPANGGDPTDGGESPQGSANSGEVPPWYNVIFKSTNDSKGLFGHVTGAIGDFKTFGLGFLNQNIAGGALSMLAGFKYDQIEGTTNYRVFGKNGYSNSLLNNLYQKYKNYTFNGEERNPGPNSRRISETRLNAFLDSKKLRSTDTSILGHITNSVKAAVNNSWNPFTKKILNPKNWLSTSILNKDFFAKSNVLKLSGPVGYLTTAANSVFDYGWGDKKDIGLGSTNFAADLTTDVAIGVGSTAIGSVASSIAAGAVAGSAVPGLGTVVGAGAGLLAGLTTTYLINGTGTGRRMKKAVSGGIKKAYDWVGGGIKKLGGLFG